MLRTTLLALAAALTLGACATPEETAAAPDGRDCFRNDDIFGYGVVDDHTIDVRANGRHYLMTTSWNARELDWTQQIAIRSATGWICTGNGLGVEIIGGDPPRRFPVNSVARRPDEPAVSGS